jgi:hypothetical protein
VKAQVKQDKLTGNWLAIMSNDYFGTSRVYKFATKLEAQSFVDDENQYRKELLEKIPSIHDYFNTDMATSFRNRLTN